VIVAVLARQEPAPTSVVVSLYIFTVFPEIHVRLNSGLDLLVILSVLKDPRSEDSTRSGVPGALRLVGSLYTVIRSDCFDSACVASDIVAAIYIILSTGGTETDIVSGLVAPHVLDASRVVVS
jgi:hypothetical protein